MAYGYQGHIGRVGGGGRMAAQGQGGMHALYSGTTSFIRHATTQTFDLATGKAVAIPLVCYNTSTKRGTVTANDLGSSKNQSPYITLGSRVDNMSINLTVQQTDTSKVNEVYTAAISTSFTDAALASGLMDTYFANLIQMDDAGSGHAPSTTGYMDSNTNEYSSNAWSTPVPVTWSYQEWLLTPQQKHSMPIMRKYSLYSGRVATAKNTMRVPSKNRRAQFGNGWWLVIMHDSPQTDTDDVKIHLDTFFKEIPATDQIAVS